MRQLLLILIPVALAGCARPAQQGMPIPGNVRAHCDYVGAMRGNDGYGGVGPRAACYRYWQETGQLPPAT